LFSYAAFVVQLNVFRRQGEHKEHELENVNTIGLPVIVSNYKADPEAVIQTPNSVPAKIQHEKLRIAISTLVFGTWPSTM
jgi:hypothetical protein